MKGFDSTDGVLMMWNHCEEKLQIKCMKVKAKLNEAHFQESNLVKTTLKILTFKIQKRE